MHGEAHLVIIYVRHEIKMPAGYYIYPTTHRFSLPCAAQSDHMRDYLMKMLRTFLQNKAPSANDVIEFLSVYTHFCNSPVSLNIKFFNVFYRKYQMKRTASVGITVVIGCRENFWRILNKCWLSISDELQQSHDCNFAMRYFVGWVSNDSFKITVMVPSGKWL